MKQPAPIAILCASLLYTTVPATAVGSGGILNLIPQAEVWQIDSNQRATRLEDYRVYVHPMEGSIVLLNSTSDIAIALDKNKKHAITMDKRAIKIAPDSNMIDVPEKIPYIVLKFTPHFGRTLAILQMEDGYAIKIVVKR